MAGWREGGRSSYLMRLKMAAVLLATNQETALSSAGPIQCSYLIFITCVPSGEQLIVQGKTNYKIWPQGHNNTYLSIYILSWLGFRRQQSNSLWPFHLPEQKYEFLLTRDRRCTRTMSMSIYLYSTFKKKNWVNQSALQETKKQL